jgi:O-antigen/teichoic acid export membrane protein
MLKNSAMLFAGRISARFLGLLSTIIVARILVPEDYGIIAACMIVQDFAARIQKLGIDQNIISKSTVDNQFLSSSFLLKFLLSGLSSLLVFAFAGQAAFYLENPEVEPLLQLVCWSFMIQGLCNLNLITEAKKQNFKPEIFTMLCAKIVSVTVTLVLAKLLNNYWALAIGMITADVAYVFFSYIFTKAYLPKWASWTQIKEIMGFSKWIFLHQNVDFFNAKIFQLAVVKLFDVKFLGYFSLGTNLANIYVSEVSAAVDKSNLSHLSNSLQEDKDNSRLLLDNMAYVFDIKHIVIVPAYLCVAAYPHLFIGLLLGEQWLEMAPFLSAFAISLSVVAYNQSLVAILISLRQPKRVFNTVIMQLTFRCMVVALAYYYSSVLFLAYAGIFVSLVGSLCLYCFVMQNVDANDNNSFLFSTFYQVVKVVLCLSFVHITNSDGWLGLCAFVVVLVALTLIENRIFASQAYSDMFTGISSKVKQYVGSQN